MKTQSSASVLSGFAPVLQTGWVTLTSALACLAAGSHLAAAPVAETKIRKAVEHWVRHVTAARRADAAIERLEAYQEQGKTVAFIAHLKNGGYCLAGTDSLVLPVYLYSSRGTYDAATPGVRAILEEIGQRTGHLRKEMAKGGEALKQHRGTLDKRAAFWKDLEDGSPLGEGGAAGAAGSGSTSSDILVLPLSSQWGQSEPYNHKCPQIPSGSGNHALVGCVATASAQVMRYWSWPATYDWSLLEDVHTLNSSDDDGDREVARLCADVGAAMNMSYGLTLSSATGPDCVDGFNDVFDYHPDVDYSHRDTDEMEEEIRWSRPFLMCGWDNAGNGHCWVVYGYDAGTSQFLMNMGWNGTSDSWYTVDNVPGGFTNSPRHITRIAPSSVVRFVGEGTHDHRTGAPTDPYVNIEDAVDRAPDGTTLVFKANSTNTFSGSGLVIDRPFTLKGINAVITNE